MVFLYRILYYSVVQQLHDLDDFTLCNPIVVGHFNGQLMTVW